MVSKRIKYARAHLSRRRYIAILATPLWRRVQRIDFNCLPRPYSVQRGALRARATKRIKIMAKPKYQQKKYEPVMPPLQWKKRDREALTAEPPKRILDLALPKRSALVYSRRLLARQANRAMLGNVNSLLRGIRKSRYQKYRIICNSLQQRAKAREMKIRRKFHKVLKRPEDWERHKAALEKLAAPKPVPKPPPKLTERTGQTFDEEHLHILAQPQKKWEGPDIDPYAVKESALVYHMSNRMRDLAYRPHLRREPRYKIPGRVVPEALTFEATPRIIELAKPAERPPGLETDLKEDAFSVLPRALKAYCTKRTRKLAMPKKRRR